MKEKAPSVIKYIAMNRIDTCNAALIAFSLQVETTCLSGKFVACIINILIDICTSSEVYSCENGH